MKRIIAVATLLFAMISCTQRENPFFTEWDTPYGIPPFEQIQNADYLPAIEEGIAQQKAEVEAIVNQAISEEIDVICEEMSIEEARATGAVGIFDDKYGDRVKVYTIPGYDSELCGGPHAANTRELERFKIQKEKSSSAGVRRIVAVIGDYAK